MAMMMFRHSETPRQMGRAEPDADYVESIARQAAIHASRNEYADALACYQQALLLDDSRAQMWFNYANLQARMGMREDAAESFEFALRIEPRLYAARYSLAKLLFELGRPLAAMANYEEVIAQNPDYMPAWRNLGKLHHALGNLACAQECFREAMRRAPHDAELRGLLEEVLHEGSGAAQN